MSTEARSARTLFLEAVERHQPDQWPAFLDSACGSDDVLRSQVLRLLDAHAQANSFMALPAGGINAGLAPTIGLPAFPPSPLPIGEKIGRYKLLEQIGEGGMGVVYVAEQAEPVRRKVALKIIKPGMDSREVISRFEVERQALAIMDHPNIARVLDAGTTDAGRPYFVMELVRGLPITEYCDKAKLTPKQRLELFVTVCQAVQHAHLKGIIHRDLKPSNVMITLHDGTPVVKVIDFGVAKAMNQQLSQHTIYTAFAQILGTPLYMSPEQAEMSGLDIDTRSDVYSLGVLLYELLTGQTPFDRDTFNKLGLDEMRRKIREDEPARPSLRVNTLDAKALSTLSQQRGIDERRLSQFLRSELDWIVMQALEKDRTRRYESASAFAADVQRYLDDLPVEACPPSASYRLRKYALRNKVSLAAAGLIAAALLLGTVVSVWQAVQATAARQLADEQRQRAEASFQKSLEAVDRLLSRVGDENLRDVPQMELVRQKILQDAVEFYRGLLVQRPENTELRFQTAFVLARLGDIYFELGQLKERDAAFQEALHILEALHAESPEDLRYQVELAQTFNRLGFHTGTTAMERESFFQRAIVLLQPLVDRLPADTRVGGANIRSYLANSRRARGTTLITLGQLAEAEADIRGAIALCEKDPTTWWGQDVLASCYVNLATLHAGKGSLARAIEATEQAIAVRQEVVKAQPSSGFLRNELAWDWLTCAKYLVQANRLKESEQAYRQSVNLAQILVAEFPSTRPYRSLVNDARAGLISINLKLGNKDEVTSLIDKFVPVTFEEFLARAKMCESIGMFDVARTDLEQAIKLESSQPPSLSLFGVLMYSNSPLRDRVRALEIANSWVQRSPESADAWEALGTAHRESKKYETALEYYRKAVSLGRTDNANIMSLIAELQTECGRFEDASATLAAIDKTSSNHHRVWHARGMLHAAQGEFAQAIDDYSKSLELDPARYWIHKRRGLAYFKLKRYDEALSDIAKAVELQPADVSNLTWISPALTAACPDEDFRQGIRKLADKTIELTGGQADAFAARATILVAMQEFALARADFDLAAKDPKASHSVHYWSALAALSDA